MAEVERSIEVHAPAAAVWAVVEDLTRLCELSASTEQVEGPDRLTEVGQRFEQVVRLAGKRFKSTWTVTQLDPGKRLVVDGELMPKVRYEIEQAVERQGDDRSTLTVTMRYELPLGILGRLANRLGAERRALNEAGSVVEGIKRLAEAA